MLTFLAIFLGIFRLDFHGGARSWGIEAGARGVVGGGGGQEELDYYELLKVGPKATEKEIKKVYRSMALRYHPDKIPSGASEAEREEFEKRFMRITAAYDVLSNEMLRNRYNELIRHGILEYDEKIWNQFLYDKAPPGGFGSISAETPWWVDALMTIVLATFLVVIPIYLLYLDREKKKKQLKSRKSNFLRDVKSTTAAATAALIAQKERSRNTRMGDLNNTKKVEFSDFMAPSSNSSDATAIKSAENLENPKNSKNKSAKDDKAGTKEKKRSKWSEEEMSILAKAIAKYPGGTPKRWNLITRMLAKRCQEGYKTQKQVIQTARALELKTMGYRCTNALGDDKTSAGIKEKVKKVGKCVSMSQSLGEEDWSREHQSALESAPSE
ncbi:hypothetical protein AAMO2058_000261300 [Amorphochlora amoebiformis]